MAMGCPAKRGEMEPKKVKQLSLFRCLMLADIDEAFKGLFRLAETFAGDFNSQLLSGIIIGLMFATISGCSPILQCL
jgi:hypothetical protein